MNYYDEEISIGSGITGVGDMRPPHNAKMERISSRGSIQSDKGNNLEKARSGAGTSLSRQGSDSDNAFQKRSHMVARPRQRMAIHGNSTDDDGLLQDILDHDDEGDDDDEEADDSDLPMDNRPSIQPLESKESMQQDFVRRSGLQRSQQRPSSSRIKMSLPTAKVMDNESDASETDSEQAEGASGHQSKGDYSPSWESQMTITADKWEKLSVPQEVKDLFPYILKYIPQHIETAYHLQPFIPEYVPAVGDVDAFLKVTDPPLLNPQRSKEINEHIKKLGLYFLDEPSGTQSEPSLLNMKLRSALTGSGKNSRSASAALVPIAKSNKDIDKWINEVEQVHMSQSVYDVQPRKDIENMIIDWPRSYANTTGAIQDAYQRSLSGELGLTDYIRILCQQFAIEGPLETQADYLLSVQTLFALYLAANQAWE